MYVLSDILHFLFIYCSVLNTPATSKSPFHYKWILAILTPQYEKRRFQHHKHHKHNALPSVKRIKRNIAIWSNLYLCVLTTLNKLL